MKRWRDLPVFALADTPRSTDREAITEFKAWRVSEPDSRRQYTVVRLTNGAGATGYGEGAPAGRSEITEAKSLILGRLPSDAEFVRHHMASLPAMEAAVSNAMLDMSATTAGVPIYQYLGGPTRHKARVLAHLEAETPEALDSALDRAKQSGAKAFTFPLPERDSMTRIQQYVDVIRQRVEHLRERAGDDTDFVLDAHSALTPGDASAIATALEKLHLLWFDEPTALLTSDQLEKITDESVMPVGLGRNVHDIAVFQNLLRWGCVDVLRPSVGLNSARKIRRMATIAETHYVAVAPYHNGGPIGTIAAIHLAASLPNFFIQQVPQTATDRNRQMRAAITSGDRESAKEGFAPLINAPGLGVKIDESALGQYSEETI